MRWGGCEVSESNAIFCIPVFYLMYFMYILMMTNSVISPDRQWKSLLKLCSLTPLLNLSVLTQKAQSVSQILVWNTTLSSTVSHITLLDSTEPNDATAGGSQMRGSPSVSCLSSLIPWSCSSEALWINCDQGSTSRPCLQSLGWRHGHWSDSLGNAFMQPSIN